MSLTKVKEKLAIDLETKEKDLCGAQEEIKKLHLSLNQKSEEKDMLSQVVDNLNQKIKEMAAAQEKIVLEQLSQGEDAALDQEKQRLEGEKRKEFNQKLERQAERFKKKLHDV